MTVEVTGDGEHTVTYRAVDMVENISTIGLTTVRIDSKSPTAVVTTPQAGDVYVLGEPVAVAYGCDDDRSGIASCIGEVANGGQLDTSSVGSHTFDVEAVDKAGNDSFESVPYNVTYEICPLFDQGKS